MKYALYTATPMLPVPTFGQQYDHVVVTADSFVNRFAPLCSYVGGSLGLRDAVVTVEDIHAQHAGRDNPEKIRNFICHVYQNWGTTYVLLGDDVEIVPHRNAGASRLGRTGDMPCGLYDSALDGDWDANDVCRLAPGVYFVCDRADTRAGVGRIVIAR